MVYLCFYFWRTIEIDLFDPYYISEIRRSDDNFPIPDSLYVEVLCFLTFNVCAMLGSLTTSWIQWVIKCCSSPFCIERWAYFNNYDNNIDNFNWQWCNLFLQPKKEYLVFPVLLRIVFVPLFLMCNCFLMQRHVPVYIKSDWIYWAIGVLMAYTSGYLR